MGEEAGKADPALLWICGGLQCRPRRKDFARLPRFGEASVEGKGDDTQRQFADVLDGSEEGGLCHRSRKQ